MTATNSIFSWLFLEEEELLNCCLFLFTKFGANTILFAPSSTQLLCYWLIKRFCSAHSPQWDNSIFRDKSIESKGKETLWLRNFPSKQGRLRTMSIFRCYCYTLIKLTPIAPSLPYGLVSGTLV